MNVTEEVPLSLNCTISGDGSYTWERRDGIEIENAKRQESSFLIFYKYVSTNFFYFPH